MVHSARFELTTYCSGGNRSIQLSYECIEISFTIQSFLYFATGFYCFSKKYFKIFLRWEGESS